MLNEGLSILGTDLLRKLKLVQDLLSNVGLLKWFLTRRLNKYIFLLNVLFILINIKHWMNFEKELNWSRVGGRIN